MIHEASRSLKTAVLINKFRDNVNVYYQLVGPDQGTVNSEIPIPIPSEREGVKFYAINADSPEGNPLLEEFMGLTIGYTPYI